MGDGVRLSFHKFSANLSELPMRKLSPVSFRNAEDSLKIGANCLEKREVCEIESEATSGLRFTVAGVVVDIKRRNDLENSSEHLLSSTEFSFGIRVSC